MITDREQYKRLTIFLEVIVLLTIHTLLYVYVWKNYYMSSIQIPFARRGNLAMVSVYPIMLLVFGKLFGVFKVAIARKVDMICSNIFNVLVSNVAVYFLFVLLIRYYHQVSIWPLVIITLIECAVIVGWVMAVDALNNVLYPPHDMLLIHGDYSLKDFVFLVNEKSSRYSITEEININEDMGLIIRKIDQHDSVIISDLPAQQRNDVLKYCYGSGKRIYMLPKITDIIVRSASDIHLFDTTALLSRNFGLTFDQLAVKRALDILISGIMIVCTGWLMLIIAAAIKKSDGGPVFYRQDRLTRNKEVFKIIKFRSMRVDAEANGPQLSVKNDPRITKVGHVLRECHLDELPQLFNVFIGQMSMVGPRPERPSIAEEYTECVPEFDYRLKVKAGLTGYAQVYGRYNSTPYNKLRLDLTYIQNYSVWLDLKCMMMTVRILFTRDAREGIDEDQRTAMKKQI